MSGASPKRRFERDRPTRPTGRQTFIPALLIHLLQNPEVSESPVGYAAKMKPVNSVDIPILAAYRGKKALRNVEAA